MFGNNTQNVTHQSADSLTDRCNDNLALNIVPHVQSPTINM